MMDNDHKPVTLTGLLLLAAIALIFLVIVWLIGSAFVKPPIASHPQVWNHPAIANVVLS